MAHKRIVGRVLVIVLTLLAAGVVSVVASTPVVALAPRGGVPAAVLVEAGWEQANSNGFGDVDAREVSALEPFNNFLYAGTHNAIDGALILRSPDGVTWTPVIDPGFGNPHDTAPPAILDFVVSGSYLYASTGRRDSAAKIFRSSNGLHWAPVVNSGFADQDNVDITAIAPYGGMLYAAVTNVVDGVQIWRSYTGDSNSWIQDSPPTLVAAYAAVTSLAEFDGALYAAVESEEGPVQIWRTTGGGWSAVVPDGFGDATVMLSGGLAEFGGYLYAGAGSTSSGAQLWRTSDGDTWLPAIAPGTGDTNNQEVASLFVFQSQLYAGVSNATTGMEVWHSADGTLWEQSNQDGFGDSNNVGTNANNATAEFAGRLYAGTANGMTGGELWRLTTALSPVYGVTLSPDASLAGLPGTTVTYTVTITNTGTVADTYLLAHSGNSWPTAVSTLSIAVAAGASGQFDVSVSIPPGALAAETDTVSVMATSQGDTAQIATAALTTTVLPTFGVTLSGDDALSGTPGTIVTYTLTLTNSGGTADSYSLGVTGNSWPTILSTSNVSLAPGASVTVYAAVAIPADAAGGTSDAVTVTAISAGDSSVNDSAILTTTVSSAPVDKLYLFLPLLMRSEAGGI